MKIHKTINKQRKFRFQYVKVQKHKILMKSHIKATKKKKKNAFFFLQQNKTSGHLPEPLLLMVAAVLHGTDPHALPEHQFPGLPFLPYPAGDGKGGALSTRIVSMPLFLYCFYAIILVEIDKFTNKQKQNERSL